MADEKLPGRPLPNLENVQLRRWIKQNIVGSDEWAALQPLDADLTAIAALGTTGFPARTAADTWALRTLTEPAAGLTITNPAGVAGNPTFALANDLAALEALSGTNTIYYRSAANTWTAVTIGDGLDFSTGTLSADPTDWAAIETRAVDGVETFTDLGGYRDLQIVLDNVTADAAAARQIEVSSDNGSNWDTVFLALSSSTALAATAVLSDANGAARSTHLTIWGWGTTLPFKAISAFVGPLGIRSASAFNAFRISNASGNLTAGTIYVQGIPS